MKLDFQYIKIVIAITLMISGSACVEDKSDRPSTANIETVIDQGRFDEAIFVLSSQLTRNKDDAKSRLLLASAYAGRAGVQMKEFMQVARTWTDAATETEQATEKTMSALFDGMRRQSKSKTERDLTSLFEGLYRTTMIITRAVVGFNQIPTIADNNQLLDVQHAVETLSTPNVIGGGALYRGLLRLILFKNGITNRKDQAFLQTCQLDVERLRLYMDQTQKTLIEIMGDFALGTRDQERHDRLIEMSAKFSERLNNMFSIVQFMGDGKVVDFTGLVQRTQGTCK